MGEVSLRLQFAIDGTAQEVALVGPQMHLGRDSDNDIVLSDVSVSRRHALLCCREASEWSIEDLGSTNGIQVNGEPTKRALIGVGDKISVGVFELRVVAGEPRAMPSPSTEAIPNATIVRRLADFSSGVGEVSAAVLTSRKRPIEVDQTAGSSRSRRFLELLNRLARDLIHTDTADDVLLRVMDIAFGALPIERGFILLGASVSDVECRLARIGDQVELRPRGELPVSRTILRTVMEGQVGMLTLDALDDERLLGGKSIQIHGIRAAMCAPLWSEDKITGFIQVDSAFQGIQLDERHLDFLITLANYAAVGVERSEQRRVRGRLERYHSPAVLEAVMREDTTASLSQRHLRKGEVTVLFGDLVGFTAFSESAALEDVAELLSGYCTRSVATIFRYGGTLDKFIGDCVMAFFGAPMDQPDHAERGVRAAIEIQSQMAEWNVERRAHGLAEVRCRVALNSGPVLVGDVGSDQRVDYTVLGNAVNVAARLESEVAEPGDIIIGDATRSQLGDQFEIEALGETALTGLQTKVRVHRVLGEKGSGEKGSGEKGRLATPSAVLGSASERP